MVIGSTVTFAQAPHGRTTEATGTAPAFARPPRGRTDGNFGRARHAPNPRPGRGAAPAAPVPRAVGRGAARPATPNRGTEERGGGAAPRGRAEAPRAGA